MACSYSAGTLISINYGSTFTAVNNGTSNWSCAISGTGQYMLIGNQSSGKIFSSINYGDAFTSINITSSWRTIQMSKDGKYSLASSSDYVYLSTNYGASFTSTGLQSFNTDYGDTAISSTGQYMTILNRSDISAVYISTNSGANWSKKALTVLNNGGYVTSCAMSGDGQTIFIGSVYAVKLYKITNISADIPTVTEITAAATIRCPRILVSSDALYIFISDISNKKMYYSTNGGSSFKLITNTSIVLNAMAMTPDAHYIIGNEDVNKRLYISHV